MGKIEEIRENIDGIDGQLLDLLNQRMEWVREIGKFKQATKATIYRPEREKAIIDRLSSMTEGILDKKAIEAIFLEIFAVSRNVELPEKIAYLGPEGSFSHQAAEIRFGAMSQYFPLKNIAAVFDSVVTGRCRFGVVPLENNQEGIVLETINRLVKDAVMIVAEIPVPVHFCFASTSEQIKSITKIYSKDIAFRQCKDFIANHFDEDEVKLVPVTSTSRAANLALEEPGSAALCSPVAARMYNLPVLFENVEDSVDNITRFLIISKEFINQKSGQDKTTIVARLGDEPGCLAKFLREFHISGINLTKIESYPARNGQTFKYWFFLEFEGHADDAPVKKILNSHENDIKWLGSYVKLC